MKNVTNHVVEDISVITISNEPNKVKNMLENLHFSPKEHIFVVDNINKFDFLIGLPRIIIIPTKSKNFAYLLNLGISLATAYWIIEIDSDEHLDTNAIAALNKLSRNYNAYAIEKLAKFLDTYPHYLRRKFIFLHAKNVCFYEGRVDEKVNRKKLIVGNINGKLYNESYNTFETFRKKLKKYSSLHKKSFKEVFKSAIGGIYIYFQTNAFEDGTIGLKLLFYGLLFPFYIAFNGTHSYKNISINEIELKLYKYSESMDVREMKYIENMIKVLKNNKITRRKYFENLEQLDSPFQ